MDAVTVKEVNDEMDRLERDLAGCLRNESLSAKLAASIFSAGVRKLMRAAILGAHRTAAGETRVMLDRLAQGEAANG